MIKLFLWLAIAWVGGIAAILGSLMLFGSLLLWLIPNHTLNDASPSWQKRLSLVAIAAGLMLAGLALLKLFPFPIATNA